MRRFLKSGVTLLELLVALLIIAILSTIAVSVYTGQVERARYARARSEIREIELACHRYEIDLGQFPPSGSFNVAATTTNVGSGFLQLALLHSMSASAYQPADVRWQGPYMEFDESQLGAITDSGGNAAITSATDPRRVVFLDPWGNPYIYIKSSNYVTYQATELPVDLYPISIRDSETWYNPTTFQIISMGRDGQTLAAPNRGLDPDYTDVTNFIGKTP